MGPISYKPAARLRNQRRWPSDLLPGTRLHCQGLLFQPGSTFLTTVFTNVYILAWLTGPAEFMTRNKPLRGEKKTAPTSWGRSVYEGPGAALSVWASASAMGGGRRHLQSQRPSLADGKVLPFSNNQRGKEAPSETSWTISIWLVSVLSP